MSWRRERNDSSCIFAAVSGREPCWCVKWGLHRAVAKATLGEVPLLVLLAHGSELGERWAGSWVTQRAAGSCHTLGEQPEGQERGCLCLAGCSQGAKQLWRLAMEFRPGESLQGSAVCSGSFVEQSKGCCHSRHGLHQHSRRGSPCAERGRGALGERGVQGDRRGQWLCWLLSGSADPPRKLIFHV